MDNKNDLPIVALERGVKFQPLSVSKYGFVFTYQILYLRYKIKIEFVPDGIGSIVPNYPMEIGQLRYVLELAHKHRELIKKHCKKLIA